MSTTLAPTRRTSTGRPRGPAGPRTRDKRPAAGAPRARPATTTRQRRMSRAPRAPFVLLVVGLLGGGLVSLLLLNTVLAQDAFALHALRKQTATLEEREQALRQEVARAEAPQTLARKARALGMVPASGSAFIDTGRGKIVGNPKAAPTPASSARASDQAGDRGEPSPRSPRRTSSGGAEGDR